MIIYEARKNARLEMTRQNKKGGPLEDIRGPLRSYEVLGISYERTIRKNNIDNVIIVIMVIIGNIRIVSEQLE